MKNGDLNLLKALIKGNSIAQYASAAGISERTVYRKE